MGCAEIEVEDLELRARTLLVDLQYGDEHLATRRGVELIREVDRAQKRLRDTCCADADLSDRLDRIKHLVGVKVFDLPEDALRRTGRTCTSTDPDERDAEAARATIERLEREKEQAERLLTEINARRKDDYPPGTYVIVERKPDVPGHVFGPPRVFSKDENGTWWSSNQVSSPVSWPVVRRSLNDERLNAYSVNAMESI